MHNNKIHTIYKQTGVFVFIFSMLMFCFYKQSSNNKKIVILYTFLVCYGLGLAINAIKYSNRRFMMSHLDINQPLKELWRCVIGDVDGGQNNIVAQNFQPHLIFLAALLQIHHVCR
jgi:hypothetical protein